MLIEGYRECRRALDNGYRPQMLFYCEEIWLKHLNEPELVQRAGRWARRCTPARRPSLKKWPNRERPDGLLMMARI
jgi:hypothetical protein